MTDSAQLYIDLLKKCVGNWIYDDDLDLLSGEMAVDAESGKYFAVNPELATRTRKYEGRIWPSRAHTMIGLPRLDNLQYCVEEVIRNRVPGDLIETGVWRGGASIFMRGILKAHGVTDRSVWVADSFEGLPEPDPVLNPNETTIQFNRFSALVVSLEEVRRNFERYELLDEQVCFLKGWFRDTMPNAPIKELSVMRLDGDFYESTMDVLVNLYDKLSPGGFVIIDDYNAVQSCNRAVQDFRQQRRITSELRLIPVYGAFWQK